MSKTRLTHVDARGAARMVHVGSKPVTRRRAVVEGYVRCGSALIQRIRKDNLDKGNVLQVARLAGIQAAKRTNELIPLCHSLPLDGISVDFQVRDDGIAIRAEAKATWKTGVEMEAFTAVAVAALTLVDMGKAIDKAMVIDGIRLMEKTGGKSGNYRAK